jgi:hypothetical protein
MASVSQPSTTIHFIPSNVLQISTTEGHSMPILDRLMGVAGAPPRHSKINIFKLAVKQHRFSVCTLSSSFSTKSLLPIPAYMTGTGT